MISKTWLMFLSQHEYRDFLCLGLESEKELCGWSQSNDRVTMLVVLTLQNFLRCTSEIFSEAFAEKPLMIRLYVETQQIQYMHTLLILSKTGDPKLFTSQWISSCHSAFIRFQSGSCSSCANRCIRSNTTLLIISGILDFRFISFFGFSFFGL